MSQGTEEELRALRAALRALADEIEPNPYITNEVWADRLRELGAEPTDEEDEVSMTPRWLMNDVLEPDEREGRLPKYVQDKLRVLREALQEQAALAEDALRRTNPEDARVLLDPDAFNHDGIGLDPRSTVRFKTGGGYIDVDLRDDWVQIRGGDSLEIRPRVSNAVDVRDTPR